MSENWDVILPKNCCPHRDRWGGSTCRYGMKHGLDIKGCNKKNCPLKYDKEDKKE